MSRDENDDDKNDGIVKSADTADEPVWGAPQPAPARWGVRETVVAVGVAVVIAAFGGAAIYAATQTSHREQSFGHGAPGGFGGPGGSGAGSPVDAPAGGPAPDAALHAELVVPDGSGGYATMLTQTGRVLEKTATTVTVRSEDGYTQTYVLPTAAVDDLAAVPNQEVSVQAKRIGQTATATAVNAPHNTDGASGPVHR